MTIVGDRVWIGFDTTTARRSPQPSRPPARRAPDQRSRRRTARWTSPGRGGRRRWRVAAGAHPRDRLRGRDQPLLAVGSEPAAGHGAEPWIRGRVLLVGGVFLGVTAGMYGLYMVGMYSGRVLSVRHGLAAPAGRGGRWRVRGAAVQGRPGDHDRTVTVDLRRAPAGRVRAHATGGVTGRSTRGEHRGHRGPRSRRVAPGDAVHGRTAAAVDDDAGRPGGRAPCRRSRCSGCTCWCSCSTNWWCSRWQW